MKAALWVPAEYASEGLPEGWPAPGKNWEPARGAESVRRAFALYDLAVDSGFDMLSVAEHHYGQSSIVPSPVVMAAALAQRYSDVKIGILGPVLPLSNPVRVAEEIAMVDVLSGGRTIVGFFRGIPIEGIVYGANPATSADMFREAFSLVLHAWTEPETFGWEGRNYRFRTISAFPRPLQQPHPPIVSSAQTAEAATWIGSEGHMLGIFAPTVPPARAAEVVSAYTVARDAAANPACADEVLYRARVYVAETDAQAKADIAEHDIGNMGRTLAPAQQRATAAANVSAALFGGSPANAGPARERSRSEPEFHGSPESVIAQIRESTAAIGWGFLDAIFTSPGLPFEKARRSLELFGTEVLPQLTR
jgi:alkanesulfonate monooxygenase SsuD/methylene tetrahydromethanopterin reductase-like flavin-dependent oxidoreductase (luciferase family)